MIPLSSQYHHSSKKHLNKEFNDIQSKLKIAALRRRHKELRARSLVLDHLKRELVKDVHFHVALHNSGEIDNKEFWHRMHKKYKTHPQHLLDYYKKSLHYCHLKLEHLEKEIERELKKIKPMHILSLFLIVFVLFMGVYLRLGPTGFITAEGESAYTDDLAIVANENASFTWEPAHYGELTSVRASGKITGSGYARLFLDDRLIVDSSVLEPSVEFITGFQVLEQNFSEGNPSALEQELLQDNLTSPTANELLPTNSTLRNESEDLTLQNESEELPIENVTIGEELSENVSLSQENLTLPLEGNVSLPSDNISLALENVTEITNVTVPTESITVPEGTQQVRYFNLECRETCTLPGLNETSYKLRVEVENATFYLDNLTYTIRPINLTLQNVSELLPINLTLENLTIANVTSESLMQLPARINEPVRWLKKVELEEPADNLTVELLQEASNIRVRETEQDREIQFEEVIQEITDGFGITAAEELDRNIFIKEPVQKVEVEFETPAPTAVESELVSGKKTVVVSSDYHYTDVLAYSDIPEADLEGIKLYHIVNDSKVLESFEAIDLDSDGLYERIEWQVPHLSNETYEISLTILNVQSYPLVLGNWTVMFNTTGQADLQITAVEGTTWSDFADAGFDLKFLEVKCGDSVLSYNWTNGSVLITNYTCSELGFETSKVLTSGVHVLEFDFGGVKKTARNQANYKTNVVVEDGRVTFGTGNTIVYQDLANSYNLSKAFFMVRPSGASATTQYPNESLAQVSWYNETRLQFERYSTNNRDLSVTYFIVQSDNLNVWNFTANFPASNYDQNITLSPALLSTYNTKCFVEVFRNAREDSNDLDCFSAADVVPEIINETLVNLQRNQGGTACAAPGVLNITGFVVCFLDESNVTELSYSAQTAQDINTSIGKSVLMNNSFVIQNYYVADDGVSQNKVWINISNATNVNTYRGTATGAVTSKMYVVEFENNGANSYVTTVTGAPAYGDNEYNITLSSAVNQSRTFAYCSNYLTGGTGTAHTRGYFDSYFFNDTTITFTAGYDRGTAFTTPIVCQIVTWPNATSYNPSPGTAEIISITRNQPVADPDIFIGQNFSMNCTPNTGDAETGINISLLYTAPAYGWKAIETSGTVNLTSNLNPVENVRNNTMYNATVTGRTADTYWVKCRLYNGTAELNSTDQLVTVKGYVAYSVSLDQPLSDPEIQQETSFSMNCTPLTNGAPAGINVTFEYKSPDFTWKKLEKAGSVNLTATENTFIDVQNDTMYNVTVTGHTVGGYTIRCLVTDPSSSYSSGEQAVTVTGPNPAVVSVELNEPASDISINESQSFSMNCTPETGGAGTGVNISMEYSSAYFGWKEIETSGTVNLTANLNPVPDVQNDTMYNVTVIGRTADTYSIRCRLYNSSTSVYSISRQIVVNAEDRSITSVAINQPLTDPRISAGASISLNCTSQTGGASSGINISFEYNSSSFAWKQFETSGSVNLTATGNLSSDVQDNQMYNITLTGWTAGTYFVKCRLYNGTDELNSTPQQITVFDVVEDWSMMGREPEHWANISTDGPETNTTLWNLSVYERRVYGVSAVNGIVYFGTINATNGILNRIYAVDAYTGTHIWNNTVDIGESIYSSPVYYNDIVMIATRNKTTQYAPGRIYGFNATNGTLLWNFTSLAGGFDSTAGTVKDGVLYVGGWETALDNNDPDFYAINASNGTMICKWDSDVAAGTGYNTLFLAEPVVAENKVYTFLTCSGGCTGGRYIALNATNCSMIWETDPSAGFGSCDARFSILLYDKNYIYANHDCAGALKMNATNGTEVDQYDFGDVGYSEVTIGQDEDYMYIVDYITSTGTYSIYLRAVNKTDMTLKWSWQLPDTNTPSGSLSYSGARADNDLIYFGYYHPTPASYANKIFSINLTSNSQKWRYDMPSGAMTLGPLAAYDGILYATTYDGPGLIAFAERTIPEAANVRITSDDPAETPAGNLTGLFDFKDSRAGDSMKANETVWFNDSVEVQSLRNKTWVAAGNLSAGTNWTFSARVFDGLDWSNWTNSSLFEVQQAATKAVYSVSLDAPSSDPNIVKTGIFTMSCTPNTGAASSGINVSFMYNSSDFAWKQFATSGSVNLTATSNLSQDVLNNTQYSVTVTSWTTGAYNVKCRLYNGTDDVNSSVQQVTVQESYPQFSDYSVNENLIGTGSYASFNLIANDTDGVSFVNGTIAGAERIFTKGSGDEWYYEFLCDSTGTKQWTSVSANDTLNFWNSTSVSGVSFDCDATPPYFTSQAVSDSNPTRGTYVCINATVADIGGGDISFVQAELWDGFSWTNLTLSNATAAAPACNSGSSVYAAQILLLYDVALNYSALWANDSFGNFNYTDFDDILIDARDFPQFSGYSVNQSLIGKDGYLKFSVQISDLSDNIIYSNATINDAAVDLVDTGGLEWYYEWQCLATDSLVDFSWIGANDSMNNWNTTSVSGVSAACDADAPVFSNWGANETLVVMNQLFCINISVTDAGDADVNYVHAEVWNSTDWINVTMSNATAAAPACNSGSSVYAAELEATAGGDWNYSAVWANDTAGNFNYTDFSDIILVNVSQIRWNQSFLDVGTAVQGYTAKNNATVESLKISSNARVNELEGDADSFSASPANLGTMYDDTQEIEFTCSPNSTSALGNISIIYNANSSENPQGENITVNCTVKPNYRPSFYELENESGTMLLVHFDYEQFLGVDGEVGTTSGTITLEPSLNGNGTRMDGTATLSYDSNEIDIGQGTVEMWIMPTSWIDSDTKVIFYNAGSHNVRIRRDGSRNLECGVRSTGGWFYAEVDVSGWNNNEWHHIACVWDSSAGNQTMWIDGIAADSNTFTGSMTSGGTIWVGSNTGGTNQMDAVIDELRILNYAKHSFNTTGLKEPPNNIFLANNYSINLTWNPAIDREGEAVNYTLFIDNSQDFSSPEITDNTTATNYTTSFSQQLEDDYYYWKVVPSDLYSSGERSNETWLFAVDAIPPQFRNTSFSPEEPIYNNMQVNFTSRVIDPFLQAVWFESNYNGTWVNYTSGITNITDWYNYSVDSGNFSVGQSIQSRWWGNNTVGKLDKSAWMTFTIDNRVPSIPEQSNPANGSRISQVWTWLNWTNSTDSDAGNGCSFGGCYPNFTVYASDSFSEVESGDSAAKVYEGYSLAYNFSNLINTIYYWKVVAYDGYDVNESNISIFIMDFPPTLLGFAVNESLLGPGSYAKFNLTVFDADTVSFVNGTIAGAQRIFSQGAGDEWYYEFLCDSTGTKQWTSVSANDSRNDWNSTSVSGLSFECDVSGPEYSSQAVNNSFPIPESYVCINASVVDSGAAGVSFVQAEVWNSTEWINVTLSNATDAAPDCNSGGSVYAAEILIANENVWNYSALWANDTLGNINYSDFSDIVIDSRNYPTFSGFAANESIVGSGAYIKFNLSITDASDDIIYANATINDALADLADSGSDEWYYIWQCLASDSLVDFSWVGANDSLNLWNSTSVSGVSAQCDVDAPLSSGEAINSSLVKLGDYFCINATVVDNENHLNPDSVQAQIWNTTDFLNVSMSNSTSGPCSSGGSTFGAQIQATSVGQWAYTWIFANDTLGNELAKDISPDLSVTVDYHYSIYSIALNQPSSDPDIFPGQNFSVNCTPLTGGAPTGANISFMYNSTRFAWKPFETSGTVNLTASSNLSQNVLNNTMYNVSVTAWTAGTYNVRCRLYNGTAEINSSSQQVTIKGPVVLSVALNEPAAPVEIRQGQAFSMNCTPLTNAAPAGANLSLEYNGTYFVWKEIETSGIINLTANLNLFTDVQNNTMYNATVTGWTIGNYSVRCRLYNSTTSVYSGTQRINVSAAIAPAISLLTVNSTLGKNTTNENLTCYASAISSSSIVFNWKKNNADYALLNMPFDINATPGSNKVADYAGFNNNGTESGAVWTSAGKIGGAYVFNGIQNRSINVSTNLNGPAKTIEFWFKPGRAYTGEDPTGAVICFNLTPGTYYPTMYIGSTSGDWSQETMALADPTYGNAMFTDISAAWHHFAWVWNGTTYDLYMDGTKQSLQGRFSGYMNYILDTPVLMIGMRPYTSTTTPLNGTLDQLRIYNYSLSVDEIRAHYEFENSASLQNQSIIVAQETNLTGETWTCEAWAVNRTINSNKGEVNITIISAAIESISLDQPISELNILQEDSFSMNCTPETGGLPDNVNISFMYNSTSFAWKPFETSGTVNLTASSNLSQNVQDNLMYNVSVTAWTTGTYNVRCRLYNGTAEINSSSQQVTVASSEPVIYDIENIPSQQISEAGVSWITFNVTAYDANGFGDLNDNTINATFSKVGEELRQNLSCLWLQDYAAYYANYSCTIGLMYWDGPGTWNVSATISDNSGKVSAYYNETFDLQDTTAIQIWPNGINWDLLLPGSLNNLALNYTLINNTGNHNVSVNGVKVTAIDMIGKEDSSYIVPAANFTAATSNSCGVGTWLQNGSAINVAGSMLPRGNNSAGFGIEYLYYCLEQVPSGISSQNYTTEKGGSWIISVV